MKVRNKVMRKYLMIPGFLLLMAIPSVGIIMGQIKKKDARYIDNEPTDLLLTMIFFIAGMTLFKEKQRRLNKFTRITTNQILKDFMKTDEKMKKFEHIVKNKHAMQNISAFVSNRLPSNIQYEILKVFYDFQKAAYLPRIERLERIKASSERYKKIIETYIKENPDFVNEIYNVLRCSDKTYMTQGYEYIR